MIASVLLQLYFWDCFDHLFVLSCDRSFSTVIWFIKWTCNNIFCKNDVRIIALKIFASSLCSLNAYGVTFFFCTVDRNAINCKAKYYEYPFPRLAPDVNLCVVLTYQSCVRFARARQHPVTRRLFLRWLHIGKREEKVIEDGAKVHSLHDITPHRSFYRLLFAPYAARLRSDENEGYWHSNLRNNYAYLIFWNVRLNKFNYKFNLYIVEISCLRNKEKKTLNNCLFKCTILKRFDDVNVKSHQINQHQKLHLTVLSGIYYESWALDNVAWK